MNATRTIGYTKAVIGQPTPWGPAVAFCDANPQDGRWACASHSIDSFLDVREMTWHIDDSEPECLIVLRCRACGQPHGFKSTEPVK